MASCGLPASPPLADVARATADALAAPLDYPPLAQLVVPGDKVCVALADGVPQAAAVVRAVSIACWPLELPAHDITLIRGSAAALPGVADGLAGTFEAGSAKVHVLTHDPADRKRLSLSGRFGGRKTDLHRSGLGRCRSGDSDRLPEARCRARLFRTQQRSLSDVLRRQESRTLSCTPHGTFAGATSPHATRGGSGQLAVGRSFSGAGDSRRR